MPYQPSASAGTTAAGAADQVWDETAGDHVGAGSTGKVLADILALAGTTLAQGLFYSGTVDSAGAGKFVITALAGLGAHKFDDATNPYMAYVLRDGAGAAAAPQGELRAITVYTTATGEFTTAAFSAAVAATDEILILHPQLAQTLDIHTDVNALLADVGDASASTLGSILAILGDPATTITAQIAALSVLITAVDDFIDTEITTIDGLFDAPTADAATDLTIRDAIGRKTDAAVTTLGNVASIMAYVKGALNTIMNIHDTDLPAVITALQGGTAASNRVAGQCQMFPVTMDLHNAAASYDVATATTQAVLVESVVASSTLDLSDDAGFTGISIQSDNATSQIFISNVTGAKANLTELAQVSWTGTGYLGVGDKIRLTIIGDTATENPSNLVVTVKYRAVANGGYLA